MANLDSWRSGSGSAYKRLNDYRREVPLPRLHLFELEDLSWFPAVIRDLATDYLHFMETRFALHQPVVPLLRRALEESRTYVVIDLCSGAGGPVAALSDALQASDARLRFRLTDKYPNLDAFSRLAARHPSISYVAESVDATQVPCELTGFRAIFNAFHHFDPQTARAVLQSAMAARQPIGIFEIPERTLATMIPLLLTPLFVWIATPAIRPFRWHRLLWTYLLPLVPLTCWWDGIVSQWRAYTVEELRQLTTGLHAYKWEAGQVPIGSTPGNLTYLLGIPLVS